VTDACETFRHASLHVKFPTRTKFTVVQADCDGLHLPVFQYIAAVDFIQQPDQTGSAQHRNSEIPVAVVESEIQVVDFRQVTPLGVVKLINIELADAFKTEWR